ncbi:MAG TPA: hypothetical protein VMM78_08745 [Thermomicrobiales bacterium]|nr:hypothetical protein [Thermomicrobiales bacterium]
MLERSDGIAANVRAARDRMASDGSDADSRRVGDIDPARNEPKALISTELSYMCMPLRPVRVAGNRLLAVGTPLMLAGRVGVAGDIALIMHISLPPGMASWNGGLPAFGIATGEMTAAPSQAPTSATTPPTRTPDQRHAM